MLSKSKYCAFVQCPRNLWLKTYKPELAAPNTSLDARMESGNESEILLCNCSEIL